jgi:hypothetical protein
VRHGTVRQARLGKVRLGSAGRGLSRSVEVLQAGYGKLRCGRVWQCSVSQGTFRQELMTKAKEENNGGI